ncbi:hypothetical protein GALMADRAFT_210033 [Galerina marginata CBS 339.88]|uniref:Uncharacterized protein n=1 Tax=Galerina marginata (strain CBS 339.88) TaxID=685588 RepID=A0A067T610_GALM3|nr:hypothetical protein GALMADRAFT_210033 [Galerina marginata CBS 339.88]
MTIGNSSQVTICSSNVSSSSQSLQAWQETLIYATLPRLFPAPLPLPNPARASSFLIQHAGPSTTRERAGASGPAKISARRWGGTLADVDEIEQARRNERGCASAPAIAAPAAHPGSRGSVPTARASASAARAPGPAPASAPTVPAPPAAPAAPATPAPPTAASAQVQAPPAPAPSPPATAPARTAQTRPSPLPGHNPHKPNRRARRQEGDDPKCKLPHASRSSSRAGRLTRRGRGRGRVEERGGTVVNVLAGRGVPSIQLSSAFLRLGEAAMASQPANLAACLLVPVVICKEIESVAEVFEAACHCGLMSLASSRKRKAVNNSSRSGRTGAGASSRDNTRVAHLKPERKSRKANSRSRYWFEEENEGWSKTKFAVVAAIPNVHAAPTPSSYQENCTGDDAQQQRDHPIVVGFVHIRPTISEDNRACNDEESGARMWAHKLELELNTVGAAKRRLKSVRRARSYRFAVVRWFSCVKNRDPLSICYTKSSLSLERPQYAKAKAMRC